MSPADARGSAPLEGEGTPVAPVDGAAVHAVFRRLLRPQPPRGAAGEAAPPWLADLVARRMAERLEVIRLRPGVVVDASGPLGASVDLLRRAYPEAVLHAVQAPAAALGAWPSSPSEARAGAALPWWSRWRDLSRRVADAPAPAQPLAADAAFPPGVQMVWSNLALGFRPDPPAELAKWHAAVEPGGFVMFSALGPDTLRELAAVYAQAGWGPPAQAFTDMHDYGDMLVRAGFADPVMDQERIRLTWGDADAVLRDLRAIGTNAHPGRFAGCRTPRWRDALRAALQGLRGPDGRIGLTLEVAYGHAFRVDRAARGPSQSHFSVDELRQTARTFQPSNARSPGKTPDLG